MNKNPLVTIGIPNYNYSKYISLALDSVAEQDYENIEVIMVDDCSTDNSIEVIQSWISNYRGNKKITFIRNKENMGLTKVCNLLLTNASGKYFQPLDADDILFPQKISRQVELLEAHENAAFIFSNAFVINDAGEIIQDDYLARINYNKDKIPSGRVHEKLLEFNFVSLPTVLIRTEKAREVGGFDESLQVQDYYMWLKLTEQYEGLYMNAVTAKYRVHANSMGTSNTTNTRSSDSILNIKYRYYHQSSSEIKKIIQTNIQNTSVYLYKQDYPTAKKWIRIAFFLQPGAKTFFYYIFSVLNIPFSFIQKIKRVVNNI